LLNRSVPPGPPRRTRAAPLKTSGVSTGSDFRIAVNALASKREGGLTYLQNFLPALDAIAQGCRIDAYVTPGTAAALRVRWPTPRATAIHAVAVESASRRILWEERVLPELLQQSRASVLYVPAPAVPMRCPCPAVVAVRNMEPYCDHRPERVPLGARLRYAYLRWSTGRALSRANRIILVSAATREMLAQRHRWDAARETVIHHGIDPAFAPLSLADARAQIRKRHGIDDEFVLCVAKTRPYKRHRELVAAFAAIRSSGRKERLVIAGEQQEPYASAVKRDIAKAGLTHAVAWLGDLALRDLPPLYSAASAVAFGSTCEACPNTLLEGMACGAAIVASDIPVMREMSRDAAIYVDGLDPSAIARGLRRVLEDSDETDLLRRAALRRAAEFSWRMTAEKTLRALKEAVH
jgi:glycosyltransferase involved in cell wall biosynthesis